MDPSFLQITSLTLDQTTKKNFFYLKKFFNLKALESEQKKTDSGVRELKSERREYHFTAFTLRTGSNQHQVTAKTPI